MSTSFGVLPAVPASSTGEIVAPAACHICQMGSAPDAVYCSQCGTRLRSRPASNTTANLSERKFVSIAFFDMVGSLNAIQDKDPEDAHELLESAIDTMSGAVHAYGGMVLDRQGDGILAIFGAPIAQDDHAERACQAALRLGRLVGRGTARAFSFRAGIHSGEVALGSAASDFGIDYTATGAVVHIAARLQGLAPTNSTVMSAQTLALVRDTMLTEAMGQTSLKGLTEPVEIHRLLGVSERGQRDKTLPPALVGRHHVLESLASALASARQGHGCIVGISADPGMGKTTLIERFASTLASEIEYLGCTTEHHTSVSAFQPFADLLKKLFRLEESVPERRVARVRAGLAELSLDRNLHEAPLLDLLDLAVMPADWVSLAPLLRHERIGSTVLALMRAVSRRRPLVVVLDDLHRADSVTLQLIERLVGAVQSCRIMVLLAFRSELPRRWQGNPAYTEIHLEKLSDSETRDLIGEVLGPKVPASVERQLVRWSKGNPLFLRESVRALVELNALFDPDRAAGMSIPPSIGAVIASRIDRLQPAVKRLLVTASVIGEQFDTTILARVSGVDGADLAAQLQALQAAEFVHPVHTGRFAFDHGLFRDIAYGTLVRKKRRDLHHAAFKALSDLSPDTVSPVEDLANHAYGGELWQESIELCRSAGNRAADRYSNHEAAHHLERAIEALERADPAGVRLDDAISLRLQLRAVSVPLLRLDRITTLLAQAHEMATLKGDIALQSRTTGFLAGHAYLTQDAATCIDYSKEALRLAHQTADATLRIAPSLYLAQAQYGLGNYRRVVMALQNDRSWEMAGLSGAAVGLPVRPLFMGAYWLAISQAELGNFAQAECMTQRMLDEADPKQPFESLYAMTARGFVLLQKGEIDSAFTASCSALATADQNGIAFIIPVLASQVGYLLARQGHALEGLQLARRAIQKAEDIGSKAGRSRWCARLAEVCLRAGEESPARLNAEKAVDAALTGSELGYLCSALRLRAKIHVLGKEFDAAATDLREAAALARRLRAGPALAKCIFDRGALAQSMGRPLIARRSYHQARTMFTQFGMGHAALSVEEAIGRLTAGLSGPVADSFFGSAE